jgi:hypothetical protein
MVRWITWLGGIGWVAVVIPFLWFLYQAELADNAHELRVEKIQDLQQQALRFELDVLRSETRGLELELDTVNEKVLLQQSMDEAVELLEDLRDEVVE